MPILVAAVEAGDENYNLDNIGTTWGIIHVLINGPIIKQLGIDAGQLISRTQSCHWSGSVLITGI
jgi:hypothetical protein